MHLTKSSFLDWSQMKHSLIVLSSFCLRHLPSVNMNLRKCSTLISSCQRVHFRCIHSRLLLSMHSAILAWAVPTSSLQSAQDCCAPTNWQVSHCQSAVATWTIAPGTVMNSAVTGLVLAKEQSMSKKRLAHGS